MPKSILTAPLRNNVHGVRQKRLVGVVGPRRPTAAPAIDNGECAEATGTAGGTNIGKIEPAGRRRGDLVRVAQLPLLPIVRGAGGCGCGCGCGGRHRRHRHRHRRSVLLPSRGERSATGRRGAAHQLAPRAQSEARRADDQEHDLRPVDSGGVEGTSDGRDVALPGEDQ